MRKLTVLALCTSLFAVSLSACAPAATPAPGTPVVVTPDPGTPVVTPTPTPVPSDPVLTISTYAPLVLTQGELDTVANKGVVLKVQLVNPAQVVMVRINVNGTYPPAVGGLDGQRVLPTGLSFGPLKPDTVFEANDGGGWVTIARFTCPTGVCR